MLTDEQGENGQPLRTRDMTDADLEALVAELAADGIVVTKEEARRAVYRLAELLLLISEPLPLPPPFDPSTPVAPEAEIPAQDARVPELE